MRGPCTQSWALFTLEMGLLLGGCGSSSGGSGGGGATYSYGCLEVLGQSVKDGEWDPWFKIGLGVAF